MAMLWQTVQADTWKNNTCRCDENDVRLEVTSPCHPHLSVGWLSTIYIVISSQFATLTLLSSPVSTLHSSPVSTLPSSPVSTLHSHYSHLHSVRYTHLHSVRYTHLYSVRYTHLQSVRYSHITLISSKCALTPNCSVFVVMDVMD
ncbi:hypothetical protein Pcinc_018453 [Petrolisthes cinctipes]|uniref:Uncharacterized protein n=1 Tax=Petrolisthes cinctipes TaxID=88211 RepID=A0AAE1FN20_PETCI|nr:hypothetical protein Pcinc_018453 [Petrolisthes cinctipes]